MIKIPWALRLTADTLVFFGPFVVLASYPATIYEFFREKKTLKRKYSFEKVEMRTDQVMSVEEVKKFYEHNGFRSSF